MKNFIDKHTAKITGKIACFDRIIFKGYLPISWAENMQRFLMAQGLLIKDFKISWYQKTQIKKNLRYITKFAIKVWISLFWQQSILQAVCLLQVTLSIMTTLYRHQKI